MKRKRDVWTLDVEPLHHVQAAKKRSAVLKFLTLVLLLRKVPKAERTKGMQKLGKSKHPCTFRTSSGEVKSSQEWTANQVLEEMKINDEDTDFCSTQAFEILRGTENRDEKTWKAYVIAKTFSRAALALEAFRQKWKTLAHGVQMILKEIDDPSVLFTASFGPNCRIRNEVAAL